MAKIEDIVLLAALAGWVGFIKYCSSPAPIGYPPLQRCWTPCVEDYLSFFIPLFVVWLGYASWNGEAIKLHVLEGPRLFRLELFSMGMAFAGLAMWSGWCLWTSWTGTTCSVALHPLVVIALLVGYIALRWRVIRHDVRAFVRSLWERTNGRVGALVAGAANLLRAIVERENDDEEDDKNL